MEWLFLLLPVAAASGWWVARHGPAARPSPGAMPDATFLRGLNYLLDQRPDKAIDVFLRLAEVDSETVEIHLALGSLFRGRGEVERAIRIHQNLVARPGLDPAQRGFALYELAQDYMRAGLFDRAESLLLELAEIEPQGRRALKALIEIYQQERDWTNALAVGERLQRLTSRPMAAELAQYRCELAEEALRSGDVQRAGDQLEAAQHVYPQCVRALILQARIEMGRGDAAAALAPVSPGGGAGAWIHPGCGAAIPGGPVRDCWGGCPGRVGAPLRGPTQSGPGTGPGGCDRGR